MVVDTRKAVGVVAYLALEGQQPRDRLASLLWPESDEPRARGALRRTLSVLGKAIGAHRLDTSGTTVALRREDATCDLWTFSAILERTREHDRGPACADCIDELERAVALPRGDFLAGFVLRDSPAFDEWQRAQDAAIVRDRTVALDRLVTGLGAAGDFDGAIRHAQRRLEIDQLDELTHRRLMLLHAWSGARSEAAHQYHQCVAILDRELGVPVLDETRRLYESILADDLPPVPRAAVAARAGRQHELAATPTVPKPSQDGAPARLPLVDRDAALAAIDDLLTRTTDGTARSPVLVIEGEPGIGKTRLVEEVVARAGSLRVVVTRCSEHDAGTPHGATADLLRAALRTGAPPPDGPLRSEVARLLPELGSATDLPALDTPAARARFTRALVEVLIGAIGSDGPGVLVVDDAHWLDQASRQVIAQIISRNEERKVGLVVTWRPGSVPADDPLRRALGGSDERRDRVLTLARLSRASVRSLVEAALPAATSHADRLFEESEGVPLILADYLGVLRETAEPDGPWPLPRGTQEHVNRRLAGLPALPRQVVTAAAVLGRTFDPELVRSVSGRTDEEVTDALEVLVARGLLRETTPVQQGDGYDFTHEKVRQAVLETASLARRRLLHGRALGALSGRTSDPARRAVLAHHARLAGRDDEAATHHLAAGEHARSLGAVSDAITHIETALALDTREAGTLRRILGELRTLAGDYPGAIADLEVAAAIAAPADRPVIEQQLAGVHLRRGDGAAADAHLGAALTLLGDADPDALPLRSRLLADRSLAALRDHDDHEATALAAEALRLAEATGDLAALAQCHNLLGILARRGGDLDGARTHIRRSLELAIALGHTDARVASLNNLGLLARAAGAIDDAVDLHRSALELARPLGDRHREAALLNNLADALHAAGQRDEAMATLKEAVAGFADVGDDTRHPEIWRLVDW